MKCPTTWVFSKKQWLLRGRDNMTRIIWAAIRGTLSQVPPDLLTFENLTVMSKHGWSPLLCAAINCQLHHIPCTAHLAAHFSEIKTILEKQLQDMQEFEDPVQERKEIKRWLSELATMLVKLPLERSFPNDKTPCEELSK